MFREVEAEAATAVGTAQPTWLPLLPSLSPALLRLTLATAGYGYCLVEIFGVLSCGIVSHTGCAQYLCRDTCFDLLMLNYIRFPKPICLKYWKRYWTWRPGIGPTLASRTSPWSSLGLSFLTVGGSRLVEPSKVVTVWLVLESPSLSLLPRHLDPSWKQQQRCCALFLGPRQTFVFALCLGLVG